MRHLGNGTTTLLLQWYLLVIPRLNKLEQEKGIWMLLTRRILGKILHELFQLLIAEVLKFFVDFEMSCDVCHLDV